MKNLTTKQIKLSIAKIEEELKFLKITLESLQEDLEEKNSGLCGGKCIGCKCLKKD